MQYHQRKCDEFQIPNSATLNYCFHTIFIEKTKNPRKDIKEMTYFKKLESNSL